MIWYLDLTEFGEPHNYVATACGNMSGVFGAGPDRLWYPVNGAGERVRVDGQGTYCTRALGELIS